MNRKLKVLGLALIAVFAMSAMAASAAQAQLKITTTGKTWLTFDPGKANEGKQIYKVQPGGPEIICTGVGGHATVINNQTEVTATNISYSGCTTSIAGTTATVTMEGCDYLFHGGKTDPLDSTHGIEGEVDLICPEGKTVVIHVYSSAEKHAKNEALCTLTVPGFKSAKEITYTNTPETSGLEIPNDFDLKAVNVPTNYTRHGSILCGAATGEAKYNGEITVTGFKDLNEPTEKEPVTEGARTGVTIS